MSAYEIPGFIVGVLPADADFTTSQFKGVVAGAAANTVGIGTGGAALKAPTSSTVPFLGILQNSPNIGEAGTVMIGGVSKALAGGTIAINTLLACNASGQMVAATTGDYAVAQALESAVAGDIFAVLLIRNGKV